MPKNKSPNPVPTAWDIAVWLVQQRAINPHQIEFSADDLGQAFPALARQSLKDQHALIAQWAREHCFRVNHKTKKLSAEPSLSIRLLSRPAYNPALDNAPMSGLIWQDASPNKAVDAPSPAPFSPLDECPLFEGDVVLGVDRIDAPSRGIRQDAPRPNERGRSKRKSTNHSAPITGSINFEPIFLIHRERDERDAYLIPAPSDERGKKNNRANALIVQGRKQWTLPLTDAPTLNRHKAWRQAPIRVRIEPKHGLIRPASAHFIREINSPAPEAYMAMAEFNLPHEFSPAVERECKHLTLPIIGKAPDDEPFGTVVREDWRDIPLITIDGETAKDFDDAVFARPLNQGQFELIVAIADVAFFVRAHSALDQCARERGTSVYFPRLVVPMLPPALSEDLCSLVPDQERAVLACVMTINPHGDIERYRFTPALQQSQARFTYNEVESILFADKKIKSKRPKAVLTNLENLKKVFELLAQARAKRGALELESREVAFSFDNGEVSGIYPTERLIAHKLIEECMIAANVCAAKFLEERRAPLLYRVHEKPLMEKIERLHETMVAQGIDWSPPPTLTPKALAELLQLIRLAGFPELATANLNIAVLRSLKQAQYSPNNAGHFGLGLSHYAHFTSPIRRYPDLLVHREIWRALANGASTSTHRHKINPKTSTRNKSGVGHQHSEDWQALGFLCTQAERRADEASRSATNALKCELTLPYLGKSIVGTITGVTQFGVFVLLPPTLADGLLPLRTLGNALGEYLEFSAEHQTLCAPRRRMVFAVGDAINVRVVAVNPAQKKIDLAFDSF